METFHRVAFEKPNLSDLTANYTVVDMHFHSRHSDGLNRVSSIVRRARKLGIGIALTDHNAIEGAVRLATYAEILTIPGIEVTSHEGAHLLVYFYDISTLVQFYESDVRPFMGKGVMASLSLDMHGIIRRARQYNSLILFPHPHSAIYTGICNPMISKDAQERLLAWRMGWKSLTPGI
jgi:predicted metal-dependent phosphoesterase TrpH